MAGVTVKLTGVRGQVAKDFQFFRQMEGDAFWCPKHDLPYEDDTPVYRCPGENRNGERGGKEEHFESIGFQEIEGHDPFIVVVTVTEPGIMVVQQVPEDYKGYEPW